MWQRKTRRIARPARNRPRPAQPARPARDLQPARPAQPLTIITPCCRPANLKKLYDTIRFEFVDEWIIVYDGKHVKENPRMFSSNPKVSEYIYEGTGCMGSPQRNFGMDQIQNWNSWLFFLDDDNMIHPGLYEMTRRAHPGRIYTFDQLRPDGTILKGNKIKKGYIDTASILIHADLVRENPRWPIYLTHTLGGDGKFIEDLHSLYSPKFVYLNRVLGYHNGLKQSLKKPFSLRRMLLK